jgi:DNA-binding MarR family transcriptional regulator
VQRRQTSSWKFFTNHGQVLLCIAQDGDITLRDLGQAVGITENAVQRIVADLVESGFIQRQRIGRRNQYKINPTTAIRAVAKPDQIRPLLDLLQQHHPTRPS